ncbi:universal stress protein [Streptomyces sp. NPDC037389]|uniref:universal stress protein n=1 Tax=Streptomyces sp. NPDC037389 TaxID=3155369 RepID=UPI0033EC846D
MRAPSPEPADGGGRAGLVLAICCTGLFLEEACGRTLREAGDRPRVAPVVVRADAGPALVACARHDTDLLVVGTGGHGPLHRLRYGSARRHCLRHAACPVLVVAAEESASASWADRPMPRPARRS